MKILVCFFLLLFLSCSTHFIETSQKITFSKLDNQTGVFRCVSPNGRFLARLNINGESREILTEDISTPFRSTVLHIRDERGLHFKISERFKNQMPLDEQVARSLLNVFFPEFLKCCSYATEDGFLVTSSQDVGVKVAESHKIFRIYRDKRPFLDITVFGNGFEISTGSNTMRCFREPRYEDVY